MKTYPIFAPTCKILTNIVWTENYNIHSITENELQYIGEAKNVEQYFQRFIEIVKEHVLTKISNINNIKWNFKGFDETISLHLRIREVGKTLEKNIKIELIKKHPYYAHHINKHNINFDKTVVIQITNNDKIIFVANITVESFI